MAEGKMLRRDFLARLAAGAAALGVAGSGEAFAYTRKKHKLPKPPKVSSKLERIAISSWSLHNYFRATRRSDFNLPGPMVALLDFPDLIIERYKVHRFEFYTTHFASLEMAYLKEIKYSVSHSHSTIVNMCIDIEECGSEGTFSDPDPEARQTALEAVKQWVDVAHSLGVKSVRVSPGKVDPENLARTADAYKALTAYAQTKGVHVNVENDGAFGTENPQELLTLLRLAGAGHIGTLPNFANFPDEPTREAGLAMLFPYAQTVCHASGLEFGADGAETEYNFPTAMDIARKADFRGVYSIEFNGSGDPYAGIQKTLDELLKNL